MTAIPGNALAFRCLAQMRLRTLFPMESEEPGCAAENELATLAAVPFDALDEGTRTHLARCISCSTAYARSRGEYLRRTLPPSWSAALTHLSSPHYQDGTVVSYGLLSLETLKCVPLHTDDTFSHPSRIRAKVIVTPEAFLASVVLLDVPPQVTAIWLHSPWGDNQFTDVANGCFEVDIELSEEANAADEFATSACEGMLRLAFTSACSPSIPSSPDELAWLLRRFNVVEQDYEYALPSGLFSDTHVNVGRLCEQDHALDAVAHHLFGRLGNLDFDVVLSNGWATDMVAQRLIAIRERFGLRSATNVMAIGYAPVTMLGDIVRGSRVLIFVDVVVTGGQLRELRNIVAEFGANVVKVVALCSAEFPNAKKENLSLGLCSVPMTISAKRDSTGLRERRVFNPFSCYMTKKSGDSRGPTEFLAQDSTAAELWKHVDVSGAYEHHRIERGAHYIAFINTQKLINDPTIGDTLVTRLAQKVMTTSGLPELVLVPNRARAIELARRLVDSLSRSNHFSCSIVVASHRKRAWELAVEDSDRITGRRVFVVDSAAGYGRTVDQLARKAHEHGALRVGAAVLISRLPPGAESALNLRLTGGFTSLYSLPIQPVVVRADRRDLCPICRHKDALLAAASLSGDEAIERWAKWLSRPPRGQTQEDGVVSRRPQSTQLTLFPQSEAADFLETCSGRVASGITLHAINAAKSNGMAVLRLPELANRKIRASTRASILQHLPPSILQWSDELERDLEGYLSSGDNSSVWQAAAEVLSREKRRDWIEHLGGFIRRSRRLRSRPAPMFWSSMACNAYMVSDGEPEFRTHLEESLIALRNEYQEECVHEGLDMMLHAIRNLDSANCALFQSSQDALLGESGYVVTKPR